MKHILTSGTHSGNLISVFGADATFTGDAPVFEQPLHVLAFTNRSGSHLLGEYLIAHPGLAGFGEMLNKQPIARMMERTGVTTFPDLMARLVRRHQGPGRHPAFGIKADWDQLNMLLRHRIDRMFDGFRIIHIERDDILGQAISYHIAVQTNRWTSYQAGDPDIEPQYDFRRITDIMIGFREANISIRVTAEAAGWPVFHLTYEQLVADPAAMVARILDWAGLPQEGYVLPTPKHRKQVLRAGDTMRARYLADYAAALGFPAAG